jgi:hypothetical protein
MSHSTIPTPDQSVTYTNGSGRVATIKGVAAHLGMKVRVFNEVYSILECRPKGIGFRVHTVRDSDGVEIEFRSKELNLADGAGNFIVDDKGEAVIYSNQNDWALAADNAGLFRTGMGDELHAISSTGVTAGTSREPKGDVPGYHFIFSGFLPKSEAERSAEKAGAPADAAQAAVARRKAEALPAAGLKAVARARELAAGAGPELDLTEPGGPGVGAQSITEADLDGLVQQVQAAKPHGQEAVLAVTAPVFVRTVMNAKRAGLQDRGDAVSVFLRAAIDFDTLYALLERVKFPDLEVFKADYAARGLSFGTTKMNFGNRLRSQVKSGKVVLPA